MIHAFKGMKYDGKGFKDSKISSVRFYFFYNTKEREPNEFKML